MAKGRNGPPWGKLALGATLVLALVLAAVGDPRMRVEIRVWSPDGTVRRVSPDVGVYYQACVHPEGTSVIFSGSDGGPPRVWRAELPSGDVRALTPADKAAFLATYSWDGSSIVFSSDLESDLPSVPLRDLEDARLYRPGTKHGDKRRDFSLYLMDEHGGGVRRVTRGAHRDLRGTFSPDGSELAFFSNRKFLHPLWIVDSAGEGEPRPVPFEGPEAWGAFRPWYTKDGVHLYFFGNPMRGDPRKRIARIPAAGGVPEPLAWDDRGKSQGPFVDPDGEHLLFHTDRTGRAELWEVPLNGGEPRMLEPSLPDLPPDRKVMHPTRARDGTLAFDVTYDPGSPAVRTLRRWRRALLDRFSTWLSG